MERRETQRGCRRFRLCALQSASRTPPKRWPTCIRLFYRRFSSVSHGDMFGLNIIGLHKAPDGQIVMAPDPWWPTFLCIFNSLSDLIKCHEAASRFLDEAKRGLFDDLLFGWIELRNRTLPG